MKNRRRAHSELSHGTRLGESTSNTTLAALLGVDVERPFRWDGP